MEAEIKAEFERNGFSLVPEDEILHKCLTFCINFKLSPSDLVSNWEIYYLNRELNGLRLEDSHMDGFLSHLQNEVKERTIKDELHLHSYSNSDVGILLNDEHDGIKESLLDTPVIGSQYERSYLDNGVAVTPKTNEKGSRLKDSKTAYDRVTPFGQRMNKFVPQFTFNDKIMDDGIGRQENENMEDDIIKRVQPSESCSLRVHCSKPEPGCQFMYDSIEDKFIALENRIKKHADAFAASGLYGEPTDATLATQKNVFTVGMICCDGDGHLNEKSVVLQGSVTHSGGQRVRLDLQNLAQFSLFPGQVVGVEGYNPSGHCLITSKVVDSLPYIPEGDLPPAKKLAMDQDYVTSSPSGTSKRLSLVAAAGPFTTTDNLLFEPLTELLSYASRKQSQLLLLMGPFLDSEHPEIKKGTVDQSFDNIFHIEVLRKLQDYIEFMGPATRVILVPSIRDANHDFVFPQPAFEIHLPDNIRHQIICLSNPSLVSANEIMLGCCTVDILKQLSSEEISRTPADATSRDRMGRIATHLLSQRRYYPLYPPSVDTPLDLALTPEALDIPSIPDVLILPSDLAPFVKVLSLGEGNDGGELVRCLCMNPGRLAKGIGGGTFVELKYQENLDNSRASIIRI
ncbi:DNA polymerase alpha subunit B protein [Dioscorea alata]|uniref:DNA polymerase alpha subunit B protein n=1 Tax=Dioscorea alata TaxID=55571 RepID=A0ACB7W0J1_DIOAL|nr:DNA polymerase alpha subunit B protein [Dioscorea alata]